MQADERADINCCEWQGKGPKLKAMWAVKCDFQQCGTLTQMCSDETMQPPVKLRNCK